MRRTVITGLGIVSCLGMTLDAVSSALRAGRSGVGVDPERIERGFNSPLTGVLSDFDPCARLNRKQRKSMDQAAVYAAVAALDAVDDSGLDRQRLQEWDCGVIIGNDSTAVPSAASVMRTLEDGTTRTLGSGAVFQVMSSTATMNLAVLLGVKGANWTLAGACASGGHALGQAAMLIGSGQQEIVLAGGTQELGWQSMCAFDALGAFSRCADPERASRPFDADRDGLVPSGGAAVLVLEELESAVRRGARIYAELVGYAFSSNGAAHLSAPTVDGPVRAMTLALERSGLRPTDIDYISAHATSTQVGDRIEGKAILEVFGADGPPVASTKALTGHECWMSGASEVLYGLLMMRDGFLAGSANIDRLDPELEGLNVLRRTVDGGPATVLSNSFGFGGTNAAVVLRAPA